MGILLGVVAEHAVDPRGLQEDVGLELERPLRGSRVGGDKRAARAAGQDDNASLFQVAARAAANVRLGHAVHADRRQQPGFAPQCLHRVLHRQAVHHRGQHAHVVGSGFVNRGVPRRELGTA